MSKRRQYRRQREASNEDGEACDDEKSTKDDDTVSKTLDEMKEMQKYRKRPAGVSAVGLAFGKKFTEEESLAPDPFKLKTGGLVDLKDIKPSDMKGADDDVVQQLNANFSAETKKLDNEEHMMDYIEKEMSKRKTIPVSPDELPSNYDQKIKALYQIPDHLQVQKKEQSEEMLSNQMLSGIPEVDLGVEAKFRNIEETELAKQERHKLRKAGEGSAHRDFTLHSLRFHRGSKQSVQQSKEEEEPPKTEYIPVVGENEPELMPTGNVERQRKKKLDQSQMATDDFHYDRFRKKTRMF